MSVNGTNNNFKVNTVGNGMPQEDWATTDPKSQELDDLFDIDGSSSGSTGNSDPIDDYTCGDIQGGSYTTGADAEGTMWLEGFPPTLEEVMANNENAINYLDLVMQRYEKAKEDLRALKQTYEKAIMSGTCSVEEVQTINERLSAIEPALARCSAEMDKVTELAGERTTTFWEEQRAMKDLNNDNWIGRPHVKGSFYVQYNDDGTTTYIDPISKRPVPCPLMDPEYQAEIVSNNSLTMIDGTESITNGQDDLETTDVFFKLNKSALSNTNTFGCPIDIGIPEYFWVQRNSEDLRDSLYEIDFDEGQCEEKMLIYNEWENGKQKIPEDLSDYAQVKVTGVKIRSVEIGKTEAGDPLYRHIVEFYNDQTLITRMSIEGTEISGSHSAAVQSDLGNYVAASSVGVAFHGSNRASPLEFDASGFQSTSRHKVSDIASTLGLSRPNDDGQGDDSFEDNVGAFSKDNFTTKQWVAGAWQDVSAPLGTYENGANDLYVAPVDDSNGEGPYATYKTGIFITGVRGDITGSNYNDVIQTLGVNEYSDYATEHLPEDARQITKGDPSYSNFVNAGGGNDIVVAGRGDNYIAEATMVWVNDCGSMDENFIALPDMPAPTTIKDNVKIAPNQRTFVHGEGGHYMIYNPVEYNIKNDSDTDNPDQVEANDGSYKDDWYEVIGGSAEFGNPDDADLDYCQKQGAISPPANSLGFNRSFFEDAKSDPYGEWYDELTSVPDPEEMDEDVDWDEVMGAKTELDAEMNSFFDEMFGDLNSFMGEYQDQQQTGF